MVIPETVFDMIARHEGFSPVPYRCTAGKLTVGYGHNLDEPMSKEEARALLEVRLRNTIRDLLYVLPDLWNYGEKRASAFIDMAFNLGVPKFRGFKNMIAAAKRGERELVAQEAEYSNWYGQVGNRGKEVVKLLREG